METGNIAVKSRFYETQAEAKFEGQTENCELSWFILLLSDRQRKMNRLFSLFIKVNAQVVLQTLVKVM